MSEAALSHYRLLEPIGRGGMGVVYEAEDTRLGRRVAIKLLPPALAKDPKAVARFLRGARAASALNHPHICAVLDVGEDGGRPFIVMERLEGMTLRSVIAGRAMPIGRVLELGTQMAEALEAAHVGGVVHRDVKPANVFVSREGGLKLTDFGLAKLVEPRTGAALREGDTDTGGPDPLTSGGAALGTVGYMSPEQARGEEVDPRSDLFSLGAVLYEMATGRPPFTGPTDAVTFEAILSRPPVRARTLNPDVPPELDAILDKALEKDRSLRYQTAADLKVDLQRARRARAGALTPATDAAGPAGAGGAPPRPRRTRRARWAAPWAVLLAALVLTAWWAHVRRQTPPRFTQLTFRRGIVMSARLAPDGHTVVYSALWDGGPPEIFSRRLDNPASVSLGLPPATLLSVSSRGELAILLAPPGERGVVWLGTLARVPLSGGPERSVLEGVLDADWSPDGRDIALIRWQDGQFQLEYPVGKVLLRPCPPTRLRVSPDGKRLALLDDAGGILLLDRAGRQTRIPVARYSQRLAWSPGGDSVFVDAGESDLRRTLRRVSTGGAVEEICSLAGTLVVHDVSRDGGVLVHHGFERWDVRARVPGEPEEREASAFANSMVAGLSGDGSQVLLWHHGDGPPGLALLQPTRGGPALRVGEGHPMGLSVDARHVLLEGYEGGEARVVLVPTGAGPPQPVAAARGLLGFGRAWRVDDRVVGFDAAEPGRPRRSFLAGVAEGTLVPVTPEGTVVIPGELPDGRVLAQATDGTLAVHLPTGGAGQPVSWRLPSDPFLEAVRVSGDGLSLFVRQGSVPAGLDRIDLQTGQRAPWMELRPRDATGVGHVWSVLLTADGRGYAYTHGFFLQDLFLVEGLP